MIEEIRIVIFEMKFRKILRESKRRFDGCVNILRIIISFELFCESHRCCLKLRTGIRAY